MLSTATLVDVGSYVYTVLSTGTRGDLAKNSKILARYVSISGCITLDAKRHEFVRRTLFTLPAGTDTNNLNTIVSRLELHSFRVVTIQHLQSGQPLRVDTQL